MSNSEADPPLNPYEAPQTRELPTAIFATASSTTPSLVSPPPEVQRWINAALAMYFLSFAVPYTPWLWLSDQSWNWGVGAFLCIMGVFFCWFPPLFSWWANVTFWIAFRDMNRVPSGKAILFAGAGILLAAIIGVLELFDPIMWDDVGRKETFFPAPIYTSAPYLCWFGSMVLMFIAAIKLRRVVKATESE